MMDADEKIRTSDKTKNKIKPKLTTIFCFYKYDRNHHIQKERPCNLEFFCDNKYLHAIAKSKAFKDSKDIVDLVMKDKFENFKENFDKELFTKNKLSSNQIKEIVLKYFDKPGGELEAIQPEDWQEDPFGDTIKDTNLKNFALYLNSLWKNLTRQAKTQSNSTQSTFLHLPYASVVPGGRFREIYYWDSYWTIQGLLACKMNVTVYKMIKNMIFSVDKYGFVPNGGREYYTTRSQPPFLTLMVNEYYKYTKNVNFLASNIKYLDKEYQFWVLNRQIVIHNRYKLFQYRTKIAFERPESYWEDFNTANEAFEKMNKPREEVFRDLSSAAESGWDFSSRWLAYHGPHSLKFYSIRTTKIVPVCLNSILYKVCLCLSQLHKILNNEKMVDYYKKEVKRIKEAMNAVLWNEDFLSWYDFDLESNSSHRNFYASNLLPLWANSHSQNKSVIKKVIERLLDSGYLTHVGGIPTSNLFSGQQWDFPNSWPPLQDLLIEGIISHGFRYLGQDIMQRWITNTYETQTKYDNKPMYEKYNSVAVGYPGEGGEYNVQVGFGWTNGVILKYITKYGKELSV